MTHRLAAALTPLVGGLLLLAPAGTAQARDIPAFSVPADGATLPAAPARVTLTFSRAPVAGQSHVTVLAADGTRVSRSDTPVRDGRSLSQDVTIDRSGDFTIVYHAIFADGGQEQGSRRFSVGTDAPPSAEQAAPGHEHGVDPIGAALLVINGAVALVIVALLMIRRPGGEPVPWRLPLDGKDPT